VLSFQCNRTTNLPILPKPEKRVWEKVQLIRLKRISFKTRKDRYGHRYFCALRPIAHLDLMTDWRKVLYMDKNLREHVCYKLLRVVNRTKKGKTHGLVVDYFGITKKSESCFGPFNRWMQRNAKKNWWNLVKFLKTSKRDSRTRIGVTAKIGAIL